MKMFIFINGTFATDWLEIILNVTRSFLKKIIQHAFLCSSVSYLKKIFLQADPGTIPKTELFVFCSIS